MQCLTANKKLNFSKIYQRLQYSRFSEVTQKHKYPQTVKYPRMQARRRGRHHCLAALLMNACMVEMLNVPTLDQVRLQRVNVTNPVAVHTLLQLTPNLVVYRVEVRTFSWP